RAIGLPLRKLRPVAELEAEAAECQREVERTRSQGTAEETRLARARSTQANWQADMAKQFEGKTTVDWELQCIRVGTIAFLSTRGEPFNQISQQIVERSPFPHTLFSGYSNGGFGYLPTRQACDEGGYEIHASPFAAAAAETLIDESVRLLQEMA